MSHNTKVSSISASTSEGTLWQLGLLMWTLESHSVKTAEDKITRLFHVGSKVQSVLSAMNPTNQRTIVNSAGVVRPTKKLIHHISKSRKANCACTHSSVLIVEANIRWTSQHVHSGRTISIESGTRKSTLRSIKTGSNQFVWLGIEILNNDLQQIKYLPPECPQKHVNCQHYCWDSLSLWYHPYPRTSLVYHLLDS